MLFEILVVAHRRKGTSAQPLVTSLVFSYTSTSQSLDTKHHFHSAMAGPKSSVQVQSKVSSSTVQTSVESLWKSYNANTSSRLKLIDTFLVFIMLTGITQFLYCILVTNFPFNAFLAGYVLPVNTYMVKVTMTMVYTPSFASSVGQFVLTASLRSQVNPESKAQFPDVSPERYVLPRLLLLLLQTNIWYHTFRAFADFAFGSIVLHFFVFNFLG